MHPPCSAASWLGPACLVAAGHLLLTTDGSALDLALMQMGARR